MPEHTETTPTADPGRPATDPNQSAADPDQPAIESEHSAIEPEKAARMYTEAELRADAGLPRQPDGPGFRFAAFGALLIVVLFAGYGLGRLNNGTTASAMPAAQQPAPQATVVDESRPHTHGTSVPVTGAAAGAAVGGLSLSASGLTLTPVTTSFAAGQAQRLEFTIAGPGGAPVTTYSVVHDKPLHLIVVRRDLTGFQHLHPEMAPDGTWSIDLTLAEPGIYRMVADFTALVGGSQIATTLGTDLTVAGGYAPVTLPDPVRQVATSGHSVGYEGTPVTTAVQPLLMTVTDAAGRPETVEPYLGAFGHLVVIRQGDLGYVHVHPETQLVDGKVKFWMTAPSPGTYRMFFDFQVAGRVSTAAWTVVVS
ncbi:hypothetical protein [Actinoplanes sp. NBRC 101535]|uniref:hypothetical protein n=1 Tax=Actinoplanes sp. NBRC 101535 TaxID=3032196 RepID=UPI0024A14BBF|nr:hypothetical protein [Actinoplanes sp. NBRC 101535]GLY00745.1 hypothetical protein Acsp01_11240 [Actinoplanes sp. NBRC 101535]